MFGVKKIWQLQLQVSNICLVNNIFRTRCCTITNRPILSQNRPKYPESGNTCRNRANMFQNSNCNFMQFNVIYQLAK